MRQFIRLSFTVVILTVLGALPALAEDAAPVPVELSLSFDVLEPGQFGTVIVAGWDVASASGVFDGRPVYFHRAGESLVGLIAASLGIDPNNQFLDVEVTLSSGEALTYHLPVKIGWDAYGSQNITLPSSMGYLLDPALNDAETKLLQGIYSRNTPMRYWDGPLAMPVKDQITSPFGVFRVYNNSLTGRHTGQDIRAAKSTPVYASAPGIVVLAESLDIRGNTVIIDHGWGVFTSYCHFSEILVEPGQSVQTGDLLGMSGNTGRSAGPHLHWELAVAGTWVDPLVWNQPPIP
ncbi:MAG: M23 family metallopeptidase [Anaerolineae bacterium]|nr:M23 family metallopeptidase [Anaerolineae bacterium]